MRHLFLLLLSFNCFSFYEMNQPILNNNYKVCILGDSGTGSEQYNMMAQELVKEECDQVRIVGDIVYPDGLASVDDKQFQTKFFNPFKKIINSPKKPKFHILTGNHDYKGDSQVWTKLHKRHEYIFLPKMYYAEKYPGNICFFNLDTTPLNRIGFLKYSYDEFSWLQSKTENKSDCSFSVGFGHHPYWTSGKHHDAEFIQKWLLDSLVIGKMNSYFSGHDHHNGYEGTKEKTDLYVSGGFSQIRKLKRKSRGQSFEDLGYMVATFHQTDGNTFMKTKIKAFRDRKIETVFEKVTN